MQRLAAALPELDAAAIRSLGEDLIASSRPGDEARSVSTENQVSITTPADELITTCLTRQGLPAGAGAPWPGMRDTWPGISRLGLSSPLAPATTSTDALKRAQMSARVSPACTV